MLNTDFDTLLTSLHFLQTKGAVVSFCGGGGKSTLLYAIAEYAAAHEMRVLCMTTTHIWKPESCYAASPEQAAALWQSGHYAVIGEPEGPKLTAPRWDWHPLQPDLVLIEADGAKCHPLKVPGENEPVILPECTTVLYIAGLSALDHTIEDSLFRWQLAFSGGGERINEELMADIIRTCGRKGVTHQDYRVILNQGETPELLSRGRRIQQILQNQGIHTYINGFTAEQQQHYRRLSGASKDRPNPPAAEIFCEKEQLYE